MRTLTAVGDVLYLHELVETYSRIRIVSRDGRVLGEVPLPGRGAVSEHPFWMMNLVSRGDPGKFVFGFSTLSVSPGLYAHTPGSPTLEVIKEPQMRLDGVVVEDLHAVSRDGTRVPYHILRRADVSPDNAQPALICAYGGFNAPHAPCFPGLPFPGAAFVTAGGLFVHAHLRGGGELGRQWWDEARWHNKQNCYEDLFAIAEDLVARGRSTPAQLAVTGGSNGGLMAGVAATQRPDLWKVVVPRVPPLDLIGSCREIYTRQAIMSELCSNIDDPEEVRRLAAISPYHLVREGVQYPAIFLDAGDTDPRCSPWQARKFAARLQAATSGDSPILLHVWDNVGHGWATAKDTLIQQNTEWLAFVMRHLGLGL
jgi:prolyl oligopeptidase